MSMTSEDISLNDTTCDVTLKIDPAELERTMKLSDEELSRAVKKIQNSSGSNTDGDDRESASTSFFVLGKTSSFGSIFEKKRNVDDELSRTADNTAAGDMKDIECEHDANISLNLIEGAFDIIGKIGEGGQGVISTAADRSLGRIVALKSLHSELHGKKSAREHFIAEAKITAQLDYPGIVPVYSLNSDRNDGLHLAMKFINGETLADYLQRIRERYKNENINKFDEKHSMRKRIEIFLRCCDAVAYAHSRNVMHCDLKPENIMLGQFNDSYIMDWGIAHLINDPARTPDNWQKPKSVSGTPRYLSPEAIAGQYIDERADIYAMGLILFECVYLKAAYNGKGTMEVIGRIKNHQIEKFTHAFGCAVDRDLTAIIRKAAAFDREDRYQSINELADDIRRYLANEETVANPDNIIGRIIRFSQRHIKSLLILTLLGVLIAFGAISYSVYQQNYHARQILKREAALSTAYAKAIYVANMIELQMVHVANSLKTLSAYISFLLEQKYSDTAKQRKYFLSDSMNDKLRTAPDVFYSESRKKYISLDRMSFACNSAGDPVISDMMNRLQRLQPILKKKLLFDNVFQDKESLTSFDENAAVEYFRENGSPLLWIFGGFENGLYFSMPGYMDLPENYDPRVRSWYTVAKNKTPMDDVVWSTPYFDMVSGRLTLTASLPVFVDMKFHGVIAVDCMLQYIARFMKQHGNTEGFLLEKVIMDKDGKILLSTRENYSGRNESEEKNGKKANTFISDMNFKKIFKRQNGMLSVNTAEGRNIIYLFYKINTHDWFYIEKIDLDMLIDSIEAQTKK